MGMYDQLNSIKRAIEEKESQNKILTKETQKEQLAKYNLLSQLETELKEAKSNGFDLYHEATKDRIIDSILNNRATLQIHNRTFTQYFLNNNYYKTIKTINNIQKEAEKPEKEKEKQFERLKIQEQKENAIKRKNAIEKMHKTTTTLIYIILAPILIIGFFFIECAKAASKTGSKRI